MKWSIGNLFDYDSLAGDFVTIRVDTEGNLWLGTGENCGAQVCKLTPSEAERVAQELLGVARLLQQQPNP